MDVPVVRVNTALMLGRWKRLYGKRNVMAYKRRNFKEAYVQFLNKSLAQMKAEGSSLPTATRPAKFKKAGGL